MLNSKQRAQLRAMANKMDAIFQIGKNGVSDETCLQISNALEARELIKVKVLETSPASVRECADEIAERISADVVQVIGTKFVMYRESKENKSVSLTVK